MNALVSIIMPVFNAEKFVNRAINSVLEQSYKNFQLIIINDGSTDRSKEICHEFSQKDSRIFFINQTIIFFFISKIKFISFFK